MNWKKIWKYSSNLILITILLILFVPSWRVQFQGWYQGFFMSELTISETEKTMVSDDVMHWELFNTEREVFTFDEFSGKPIILSFWATWCSWCRPELNEISELQEHFGNKVNYLSVTEETIDKIEESGLEEDYNFLYFTQRIPSFFNVNSYPTLFILNSNLEVVYQHNGAGKLNTEENINFLESLIQNN